MVKKLPKRPTLVCSSRLRAVHGIERLVEKEADCPTCIYPWRAILVKGRVVPEKGQEIDNHKAEAGESDLAGCKRKTRRQMHLIVPDSAYEDDMVSDDMDNM